MREDIHPKYHKVQATCVCGGAIETGSTMPEIRLDVCSACHPFYTGTQRIMDAEGRVDKFNKRYANVVSKKAKADTAPAAEA
ncbi:MAG TPA: 50S ribosomal protein L31 [Coleofasciculaceae cyanobacterium]|jgi:large subunit ribosomal protein L31